VSETSLAAPQLVINSRMLYSSWIPADPQAAAALLPKGLQPAANRAIYMNQYVVDSEEQASSFGAYSLTYLGLDLAGRTAPDGVTPSRFFTHYLNSSERVRNYVRERGVPASAGTTTLELNGGELVATTCVEGMPIVRTVARVGAQIASVARGHLTYVTQVQGKLVAGNYPYVGEIASSSPRTTPSTRCGPPVPCRRWRAGAGTPRATPSSTRAASTSTSRRPAQAAARGRPRNHAALASGVLVAISATFWGSSDQKRSHSSRSARASCRPSSMRTSAKPPSKSR
jgi:hypothetical protein